MTDALDYSDIFASLNDGHLKPEAIPELDYPEATEETINTMIETKLKELPPSADVNYEFKAPGSLPKDYGIDHPTFRPSQLPAIRYIEAMFRKGQKYVYAALPTGLGKSAIARAMGYHGKVTAHAHTLNLLDQLEKYGFEILKGSQAYDCIHAEKILRWRQRFNKKPTAMDCHYDNMKLCPFINECPYQVAKLKAHRSRMVATTYRYGTLSTAIRDREGILVLDEVQTAGQEIRDIYDFTITERHLNMFQLPNFPFIIDYGKDGGGALIDQRATALLEDWLMNAGEMMFDILNANSADPDKDPKFTKAAVGLQRNIIFMLNNLHAYEWFLNAGPTALDRFEKGRTYTFPGIRMRPLTAVVAGQRLFAKRDYVLLMSATINPRAISGELGIEEYSHREFPHPIPAKYRPVTDLGFERMTWANLQSDPRLYEKQAEAIYEYIKQFDSEMRGVILTSSNKKIDELYYALSKMIPKRLAPCRNRWSKASNMDNFAQQPYQPGQIAIQTIQGYGQGVDFYGDHARFVVVAGVPFNPAKDQYNKARGKVKTSAAYDWFSAYVAVPQACGRPSRGERDEKGNPITNYAAIADGSAMTNRARAHYPKYFKQGLVAGKSLKP